MTDLTDRIALITGASTGLGEGFARLLHEAGARVVLAARSMQKLRALAEELGDRAFPVALDIADEASVIAAFDAAESQFGTVDTLICNAGLGHGGRSTDAPRDALAQTLETNLLGTYLTAREGAKRMIAADFRASERGRIVLIGSITAQQHHTGDSMYAATKAGIDHLGRNFAKEWVRQGINVNTIQPGWMETAANAEWFGSDGSAKIIAALPRRRVVPQAALAEPLLFFCSDASKHVTGATLTVDDGISL